MKISIAGVLIGGIVDVVSSVVLGLLPAIYSALDSSKRMAPHASGAISAGIHANVPLYTAQLLTGMLCSVLGGYTAAVIARRHERLNGTLSCYLCVGMGISLMVLGVAKDPLWFQTLLLISSPVLAFLGGDLRLRQRRRRAANPSFPTTP